MMNYSMSTSSAIGRSWDHFCWLSLDGYPKPKVYTAESP